MQFLRLTVMVLVLVYSAMQVRELQAGGLSYIEERMRYLAERDKILSMNIANSDTPEYKPQDLAVLTTVPRSPINLETTHPLHIRSYNSTHFEVTAGEVIEIKPNGNEVNLEHELMQKNEASLQLQEAANLYKKSYNLMKIAINSGVK